MLAQLNPGVRWLMEVDHMPDHWIAETTFVLRRRDGTRTPVRMAISAPRQVGAAEWSCRLSLQGAYDDLSPMVGNDAVQALGLAWGLARRLLSSLEAGGEILEYEDGESVPLSAYFDPSDDHRKPATNDR